MLEQRQVDLLANGSGEMFGTDDVSGRKSGLAGAATIPTMLGIIIISTDANVNYELSAGNRTLARGRVGSGGTIGVFPSETDAAPQGPFEIDDGEELSLFLDNTGAGTPSVMAVVERN